MTTKSTTKYHFEPGMVVRPLETEYYDFQPQVVVDVQTCDCNGIEITIVRLSRPHGERVKVYEALAEWVAENFEVVSHASKKVAA